MVFRVLAGFIPLLCGALILSGAIPVGKWVFGGGDPVHLAAGAARAARDNPIVSGPGLMPAGPAAMTGMDPAQMRMIQEQSLRTQESFRQVRSQMRNSPHAPGTWQPSGDWTPTAR